MSRYIEKAYALVEAWQGRYGTIPSKHAVILVCVVAEHETRCGDAWNQAHNWGAIQRRSLTSEEKTIVRAGGTPHPRDEFEELHGDSSPTSGRYQTWFWRFPNDVQGASKILEVLLDHRPAIKVRIDTLTTAELAELMYRSHYYEGFHDPGPKPGEVVAPGALTQGQRANISEYTIVLDRASRAFETALAEWNPGDPLPSEGAFDLYTIEGVQQALVKLGYDPGPADGIAGPRTKAAIEAFQRDHQPDAGGIDGIVGPKTLRALIRVMTT